MLDGLGPEFKPIIAIIMTNLASSTEKMSLADVKLSLRKYEQRLSKIPTLGYDYGAVTANLVNRGSVRALYSSIDSEVHIGTERSSEKPFRPMAHNNGQYTQRRGIGKYANKPKVICQLCGKAGHMALQCYHRFDITFLGHRETNESNNNSVANAACLVTHGSSSVGLAYQHQL